MIPALTPRHHVKAGYKAFLQAVRTEGFRGDIESDLASRTVYATDNSIYQQAPQAILFPKNRDDLVCVARLAARPEFRSVTLTTRGGGTGTNGQSLTEGLVLDLSRHMNRILSIDLVARTAVVEAGVVKDQLNKALAPHGLFFAPELSTSNRATIGGMISTDASGQGSCVYGKTSNHVLALNAVLLGGQNLLSEPLDRMALSKKVRRGDRVGTILDKVDRIARNNQDLISQRFPKLNRFLTGYNLAHLQSPGDGLNLNSILCGSEGTLAIIASATLNLLPIPACSALVNVRYDDFLSALRDARVLAGIGAASVETIDGKVLSLARDDMIWSQVAQAFPDDEDGGAAGINILEVLADTADELTGKLDRVLAALGERCLGRRGHTVTRKHSEIEAIWTMRKRAVGLLGNVSGARRPVPFVEDTAVPPEHLADYIAEFRALLDSEGLTYGMFGHVDAGVLHVRPALDLSDPAQQPLVRRVSDAVFALTQKYGGVLWGEHGKGVRSDYVPAMFGPLYPALQEIKAAFDPHNQLNPGKIATPGTGELAKIDGYPLRGQFDRQVKPDVREAYDNAAHCNGNGACFDFDTDAAMCPSFKGTGDRRFSPKGRAALIREWLRRLAEQGIDPRSNALTLRRNAVWVGLPRRLFNSLRSRRDADFSHQVREAMDTCLACKACAGQCPVKVNVPAFRAKFLELYYGRYLRPVWDPLLASIEHLLPKLVMVRWLYNLAVGSGLGRTVLKRLGLTGLPSMSHDPLCSRLRRRGIEIADARTLKALSDTERARSLVLVQDAFTTHFEAELVIDAVELFEALGRRVFVAPLTPNGKALHVHGYLGAFNRTAVRTARLLAELSQSGVALVGIDPSMTLCYRDEYVAATGADHAPKVMLPQEWLSGELDRLTLPKVSSARRFVLLPHCTERTNAGGSLKDWVSIFERLNLKLSIAAAGCCGMAGTFGHKTGNRALSETIYRLSWRDRIAKAAAGEIVMATGFSCRSQVELMGDTVPVHPLQALRQVIAASKN